MSLPVAGSVWAAVTVVVSVRVPVREGSAAIVTVAVEPEVLPVGSSVPIAQVTRPGAVVQVPRSVVAGRMVAVPVRTSVSCTFVAVVVVLSCVTRAVYVAVSPMPTALGPVFVIDRSTPAGGSAPPPPR